MKKNLTYAAILAPLLFTLCNIANAQNGNGFRPAMIGNGTNSVAANLHYPKKAAANHVQTAIPFYCEVGANGKPDHIQLYGPNDKTAFREALLHALEKGRFEPAMAGGRAVPVMVGGT